jgi:hypothetical protein
MALNEKNGVTLLSVGTATFDVSGFSVYGLTISLLMKKRLLLIHREDFIIVG